jgi:hypothetical protein
MRILVPARAQKLEADQVSLSLRRIRFEFHYQHVVVLSDIFGFDVSPRSPHAQS